MSAKAGRISLIVAAVFVGLGIVTLPGFFYRAYQLGTGGAFLQFITSENMTGQKGEGLTQEQRFFLALGWNTFRAAAKVEGLKYALLLVLGEHIPLFVFMLITVGLLTRSISNRFRTFLRNAFFANWVVGMSFLAFAIGHSQRISQRTQFPESLAPAFIIYSPVVALFGTIIGITALCRRRGSRLNKSNLSMNGLPEKKQPPDAESNLRVYCPQCGRSLKGATKEMIGDTGVCPKCRSEFVIE